MVGRVEGFRKVRTRKFKVRDCARAKRKKNFSWGAVLFFFYWLSFLSHDFLRNEVLPAKGKNRGFRNKKSLDLEVKRAEGEKKEGKNF